MPIVIRKFNDNETLGEALRALRLSIPRTLSEMTAATRIQKSILDAFERNDFQKLPAAGYADRFLSTYVKALGGDEAYFLQRFCAERGSCDLVHASLLPPKRARAGKHLSLIGCLKICGATLAGLAVVTYLGFEVQGITSPPQLSINSPTDGFITSQAVAHISGMADPKASVYVNGTNIVTHPDGSFETDVALERGLNVITVDGSKRYSRTAEIHRRIIFEDGAQSAVGEIPSSATN